MPLKLSGLCHVNLDVYNNNNNNAVIFSIGDHRNVQHRFKYVAKFKIICIIKVGM